MKNISPGSLFLTPFVAILLLFAVNPGHVANASMAGMEKASVNSAQCQAACPVLPANAKKEEINIEKDIDPYRNPALPYYANFINLAYLSPVLLGAYLLNLARKWRPPDLVILYSSYRI